jgi:hypothetical protein
MYSLENIFKKNYELTSSKSIRLVYLMICGLSKSLSTLKMNVVVII